MKKLLKENYAFFVPYFLFLLISGIFLYCNSKAEAHIWLNQFRYDFCDSFFCYATWFGDFWAVIGIVFILSFFQFRFSFLVAGANIISALLTQALKHTIFSDIDRPVKFFEGIHQLNLVAGYENYSYNSFPSGHTTSAFTTFFCLALISSQPLLKFLMLVSALLVGASRVYLSQHFLNDVYAGSIIGVVVSLLVYRFIFSDRIKNAAWLEKSILKK